MRPGEVTSGLKHSGLALDSRCPEIRTLRILVGRLGRFPLLEGDDSRDCGLLSRICCPRTRRETPGHVFPRDVPVRGQARRQRADPRPGILPARRTRVRPRPSGCARVVTRGLRLPAGGRGWPPPPKSKYHSNDSSKRRALPNTTKDPGWQAVFNTLAEVMSQIGEPKITCVRLPPRFYIGGQLVDPAACLRSCLEELSEGEPADFVERLMRFVSLPAYSRRPEAALETCVPGWPIRPHRPDQEGFMTSPCDAGVLIGASPSAAAPQVSGTSTLGR